MLGDKFWLQLEKILL